MKLRFSNIILKQRDAERLFHKKKPNGQIVIKIVLIAFFDIMVTIMTEWRQTVNRWLLYTGFEYGRKKREQRRERRGK